MSKKQKEQLESLIIHTKNELSSQEPIHPDIWFWHNTVNLVIGKRNSGKTYSTLREILKLFVYDPRNHFRYGRVIYMSDKVSDDTVNMFVFPQDANFKWVHDVEENAEAVIAALSSRVRDKLHPESIVIFDDAMFLFDKKHREIQKKLFENRQAHITYFILLQDPQGINTAMKQNLDFLRVYGGLSKHKYQSLMRQIPSTTDSITSIDLDYNLYKDLSNHDSVILNFINGSFTITTRDGDRPSNTQSGTELNKDSQINKRQ